MQESTELWEGELLTKTIHTRVSRDLYLKLVQTARQKGINLSTITRNLYKNYLEPGSIDI